LRKILAFASIVELGTGLALLVDPPIVVRLLLGAELGGVGVVAGRCFGIALLALGLACSPRRHADPGSRVWLGMMTYNALIALYVAYLGTAGHLQGLLLWPAAALHAAVAVLLAWTARGGDNASPGFRS
jgi:hypothetical protein